MKSATFRIAAVGTVTAGAFLRLFHLGRAGLGSDEIATVRWASLPWRELLLRIVRDGVHPPLDYAMQFVLVRLSTQEWVWRLPRALVGIATIAVMIALTAKWSNRVAALTTGVLLAFSPAHIRFSQEIRPYAFGLFWMALALLLLEQKRFRWWFVAVLLAGGTLYFAGLIAATTSAASILFDRQHPLRRRLPAIAAGWACVGAPWVIAVARHQTGDVPPFVQRIDWPWLAYRLQVLGTGDWRVEPVSLGSVVFWLLVVTGIFASRRNIAAVWFLGGLVVQALVFYATTYYPGPRHLLPSWLGAFALAGMGAAMIASRAGATSVFAAAAFVIYFDGQTLRAYYRQARPEWNRVAELVASSIKPGERVVLANDWTIWNFTYYWERLPHATATIPEPAGSPVHIEGPAWLVAGACGFTPEVLRKLEQFPLVARFDLTNSCNVRYVPAGGVLDVPRICN